MSGSRREFMKTLGLGGAAVAARPVLDEAEEISPYVIVDIHTPGVRDAMLYLGNLEGALITAQMEGERLTRELPRNICNGPLTLRIRKLGYLPTEQTMDALGSSGHIKVTVQMEIDPFLE